MRSEHLAYHRPVLKVGSISLRPCRSSQCLGKDGEAANLGATLDHSRGLPNCTRNRNCSGALRNCDCEKCQHKSRCQVKTRNTPCVTGPDRINKEDRAAGYLENFGEGRAYKDSAHRRFFAKQSKMVTTRINEAFGGAKKP